MRNVVTLTLVILLTWSVAVGCVTEEPMAVEVGETTSSIRNGSLANPYQYLAVVPIATDYFDCTGTMISRTVALTAAHCFCNEDGTECSNSARVYFRPDPLSDPMVPPPLVYRDGVAEIHSSFDPEASLQFHDMAVVYIDSADANSPPGAPDYIPIASVSSSVPAYDTDVITVGYGLVGANCQYTSQAPTTSVIPPYLAQSTVDYPSWNVVSSLFYSGSISYYPYVTCAGDSGGPSFLKDVNDVYATTLVSVTTGATNLGVATYGFAATTGSHYSWITDRIGHTITAAQAMTFLL